ncbi:hypothetical protein CI789_02740 [Erwinia persicina]|nr:hypothetical protein CI789_02740 [Erwinia persicina]
MAVYKVTYKVSGDETYRDVNIESAHPLQLHDEPVIDAARRDSVNYQPLSKAAATFGINIVTVTEVI